MSKHLIATIGVLVVTMSSCGLFGGDEGSTGTPPPLPATTPVASGRPADTPVALYFAAETVQEFEVLPTLTGCTDQRQTKTYLHNAHESMVWLIDEPMLTWNSDHPDPTIQIFREGVAMTGQPSLTLEPGQKMTIDANPNAVHLTLDPHVQSAWQLRVLLLDATKDKVVDWAKKGIAGKSKTRTAAVTCISLGWNAGKAIDETQTPSDAIEKGAGLYDEASSCVRSVNDALNDDVIDLNKVKTAAKADPWRTSTNKVVGLAKLIIKASPRS